LLQEGEICRYFSYVVEGCINLQITLTTSFLDVTLRV